MVLLEGLFSLVLGLDFKVGFMVFGGEWLLG